MRIFLQRIIDYGLLVILLIFPFSISIALISLDDPGHPIIAIKFSLADLIIGLLLILWGLKVIIFKEKKHLKYPSSPILVFVGVVVISFVNTTSLSEWAKESLQMIEYFVLFYLLLLNNFESIKRRTIFYTFYISTSIFLLIAFFQHTIFNADVYFVRGLFDNRNFFGAYLCITIPLVYNELINSKILLVKIWMASLLLISVLIIVTGSAIIAIVISLGVVSWKYGKKIFFRYIFFILSIGLIYPMIMPSKNISTLKDFFSIYEQGSISYNYYRSQTLLGDFNKIKFLCKEFNEKNLEVSCEKFFTYTLPNVRKGERYKELEDKKHIKNRYLEMQASIRLISENTLLGVGAGNFQNHIGRYYIELPKVNTSEPGQHNGYLIIASTLGLLGLAALFYLFFNVLSVTNHNIAINKLSVIGLNGSILACMIENMFVYLFSANLLVPFIVIVYLSLDKKISHSNI